MAACVALGFGWRSVEQAVARLDLSVEGIERIAEAWGAWAPVASIALMILHWFVPFPAELIAIARIEIDTNVVERAIRPIALNRKNALFAGSDQGGIHWGVIASLIETCKLNAVDPQAYLKNTLARLVNRHPASQIDQLMPWAYAAGPGVR